MSLNLNFINEAFAFLLGILITIPAGILGLVGEGFDQVMKYTITDFHTTFSIFEPGITTAWEGFRDIANIVMIAMFVFVAICVILNISKYGLKQFGVRILIVALLINFSLFFTKAIVDVSNVTALQFRKAIQVKTVTGEDAGIAGIFMQQAGLTEGWLTGGSTALKGIIDSGEGSWGSAVVYTIVTIFFFSALSAVLLYGLILMVSRIVVLMVLMFTSAAAFTAYMIPGGDSWWNKWWDALIKNALFAPLFMLMLWGVVHVMQGMQKGGGGADFASLVSKDGGSWLYTLNMMVVIGLLYASTKIADGLSIKGAQFAKDWGMKGFSGSLRASGVGLALYGGLRARNWAAEQAEKAPGVKGTRLGARLNAMKDNNSIASTKFGKAAAKQGVSFGNVESDKAFAKYIAKVGLDKEKKLVGESYDKEIKEWNALSKEMQKDAQVKTTDSEKQKDGLEEKTTAKESSIGAEISKAIKEKKGLEEDLRDKTYAAESEIDITPEERSKLRDAVGAAQKAVAGQDEKIKNLNERLVRQQRRREKIADAYKTRLENIDKESKSVQRSIDKNIGEIEIKKARALKDANEDIKKRAKEGIDKRKWFTTGKSVKEMAKAEIGKSADDQLIEKLRATMKEEKGDSQSSKTNKDK